MDTVEALQARREAQAQARRTAPHSSVSGGMPGGLLYGPVVPPPGVSATTVKPLTPPALPGRLDGRESPASSISATEPSRSGVDYAAHSAVFIPEGVRVTPTTSPPTREVELVGDAVQDAPRVWSATLDSPSLVSPPTRQQRQTPIDESAAFSKLSKTQLAAAIPKSVLLPGYVLRERGGILSNPKYRFYLESRDVFVMAARLRGKKQSSNYVVSLDPDDLERESDKCFAKVRSNFSGTEFRLFTTARDYKRELGVVLFEINPAGVRGPRRMTVIIPALASNGVAEEWVCNDESDEGLLAEYRANKDSTRITVLRSKAPQWNESINGFQLNFGGRIGMASVKNFQLADARDPEQNVVLQFGKWSENRFSLDFKSPLNATQAFCIALTSFDNKLLCE